MGNCMWRFPVQHLVEQFRLWLGNVQAVTFSYLSQIRQMSYGRKFSCEMLNSSILGLQNTNLCPWTFSVQNARHLYNYEHAFVLYDIGIFVQ